MDILYKNVKDVLRDVDVQVHSSSEFGSRLVTGQLQVPAALLRGKSPLFPLIKKIKGQKTILESMKK